MTRRYFKHGWQHDTDCRLCFAPPHPPVLIVQPPPVDLGEIPEPGKAKGRYKNTRGAFRPAGMRRLARWLTRFRKWVTL